MVDAPTSLSQKRTWLDNGGKETLLSFNAFDLGMIPEKYFNFLENLPHYIEVDNYILVHAGFKFIMPDPFNEVHSMLWQRNWYDDINYDWLGERIIVHGHTPVSKKR